MLLVIGLDKSDDSPMQVDNDEMVDDEPNVNVPVIEDVAANCDDGSSTNVQSNEINASTNETSDDKTVAACENSGDDESKAGSVDLKAGDTECDAVEPLKATDFDVVKEAATNADSSIAESDVESKHRDDDGLCNGITEENIVSNDDSANNIEIPTLNGETLAENHDSTDVDFDQIFDNLPENSTTGDSNNSTLIENNVQSIETVPEISDDKVTVVKTDENEAKGLEQIEKTDQEDKKVVKSEESDEIVSKVTNTSFEMSPEAEEALLKSPSMNEQCANVSTEYSESMLLKDDTKIGAAVIDEIDTVPAVIETVPETETTATTEPAEEVQVAESLFDQLKAAEAAQESAQMQLASNKPQENDTVTVEEKSCTDKNKSEPEGDLEIENNDSNGSNLKVSLDSPATSSVHSANNIDESMDVTENKENNLLEEMAGSPSSIVHCMDGGSISSARDGDVGDDNEFVNSVIDLKDGNSNDARDGFDDIDDKINISSDHEMMDQISNSSDKNDSKHLSNVSRSNEGETYTGFTSEALLDLQDSNISGSKLFAGNENDNVVDTPDKSNESVIAIDDDDEDDADDTSTVILATTEPDDKVDVGETKDIEEPPAKRMRVESDKANDVPSIDSIKKTENVEHMETADEKSSTKEENVIAVEPNKSATIENEAENDQSIIEEDDDDIVIVESSEQSSAAAADTADTADAVFTTSNKRPASPLPIDAIDDTRKKHKSNEDDAITTDAIVSDVTATEENDKIKTEAVKMDFDVVKKSSDVLTEEKSTRADEAVKSPKIEEDAKEQSNETKPVKKIELEVDLKPKPEKCEKRSIALDFAAKFKKSLAQMSRKNLEEFVLVKITEAIVHKSEFSELKQKSDAQEQMIQASRVKLQEIGKQYRDLEMVYARLKKDLENKNQIIVSPIKITRAVGLQVSIHKEGTKAPPQKPSSVQSNGVVTYSTNPPTVRTIIRSDQATASMGVQHPRLAATLATKQITHIQRQPVRPTTAIRQVVPDQQRLAATTGMELCIFISRIECLNLFIYLFICLLFISATTNNTTEYST